jgi:hypothetical protein
MQLGFKENKTRPNQNYQNSVYIILLYVGADT